MLPGKAAGLAPSVAGRFSLRRTDQSGFRWPELGLVLLSEEEVNRYLPPYEPVQRLDATDPISFGMYATPDYYMEFRYETDKAMQRATEVIVQAGKEFGDQFGRDYGSLIDSYRMDDADTALVAMGSICGTIKDAIDEMRAEGKKVGLLKIRVFRPFPAEEIAQALKNAKRVAVLDKNISLGAKGAMGLEVKDALYGRTIRCSTIS
jgi:pyruvate ferredoxin oxidoreductase alpha subunit